MQSGLGVSLSALLVGMLGSSMKAAHHRIKARRHIMATRRTRGAHGELPARPRWPFAPTYLHAYPSVLSTAHVLLVPPFGAHSHAAFGMEGQVSEVHACAAHSHAAFGMERQVSQMYSQKLRLPTQQARYRANSSGRGICL